VGPNGNAGAANATGGANVASGGNPSGGNTSGGNNVSGSGNTSTSGGSGASSGLLGAGGTPVVNPGSGGTGGTNASGGSAGLAGSSGAAAGGAANVGGSLGAGGNTNGGAGGKGGSPAVSAGAAGMAGAAAGGMGSSGMAGVAGSSSGGGAGAPVVSKAPIGWASVNADGQNGTTGGEGGPTVEVRTAAQMVTYGEDNAPRVLRIMNDIAGQFDLGSNKTIIGATNDITLTGGLGIAGTTTAQLSNVIVRNLKVNGVASEEDAMDIRRAHHVWVDHCEFYDGPDGNLDVVYESSYVTISWTKFYYTANYKPAAGETETAQHRFSNLIGNGNGNIQDRGKLRVTFHHNWWAEGVIERMPRVRFGEVHVFNNYYSSSGNNYAIGAGVEAKIVVENNFFENVKDPHMFYSDEPTARIAASGNVYESTTGKRDAGQDLPFVPPYPYTLEPAAAVKASVMQGVGPR
jgi:pectate lyase